jgi:hypothetical protein
MSIRIDIKDLPREIEARVKAVGKMVENSARSAARKALPVIKAKTPVDTYRAQESWELTDGVGKRNIINIYNGAPYVGILESGARPHPVSKEGVQNIAEWAARKFGADDKEAMLIAISIAKKIELEGSKALKMVESTLPEATEMAKGKFEEDLTKILDRKMSK